MVVPIPWEQAYIARYILGVPEDGLADRLQAHFRVIHGFLEKIPELRADFTYAEGKWTVRQVMGHIVDSQAIFAHRALCFSRGESKPLPGFEENEYAVHWRRSDIPLAKVARCYHLQSQAILAQVENLDPPELNAPGVANGIALSASLVYRALIGHECHHARILDERYGAGPAPKQKN